MNKKKDLLKLFEKHLDKQDLLRKLTENDKLHDYGYSEVHTIAAIGDLEEPNVTNISKFLNMTRGGVSKIVKKLISSGLVTSEQRGDNQQKIFYNLTETGKFLYDEHAKTHKLWQERDEEFLNRFKDEELMTIVEFMTEFNDYLDLRIKEG